MARNKIQWRTPSLIWTSSFLLFYIIFRSAMNSSSSSSSSSTLGSGSVADRRSRLYDGMARDLDEHGAKFLEGGETSQSLSLSDLFELKDGSVTPVLRVANPPVRANVLYLDPMYSIPISQAVKEIFLPYFDGAVAETLCPLKIVLDRVVLTSTGVLLGCWQVISGADPVTIRAKLRNALPRAPEKQLYDPVLLHTSFARLLGHPKVPVKEMKTPSDQLQFFHKLVEDANNKLHGYEATILEIWYVEEHDVLALALNGRMKTRKFPLGCSKN